MTIRDEIDQLVDLTCPRCGFEHTAPSRIKLLEYIRALEEVMDAAEYLQKYTPGEFYNSFHDRLYEAVAAAREAGKCHN